MSPREFWRRLRYLGGRGRFQTELNEEMRFHIECRAGELRAMGIPPAEASAQARAANSAHRPEQPMTRTMPGGFAGLTI